jgi:hypothetical protein
MQPDSLPSARVLHAMREDHGGSFSAFGRSLSQQTKAQELAQPLAERALAHFQQLAQASLERQREIETADTLPFDRYLQQLNQLVEELNVTFILEPEKRENYDEFCKKYIPMIKNLSVSPASFSPNEWKKIVYTITNYYPELIRGDGSNSELLWPWYYMDEKEQVDKITENKRRSPSEFGKNVISSYNYLQSNKRGYSCFNMFGCCKPKFILEHEQHIGIHTDEHKA